MKAVLEYIPGRHGGEGESMHKESFGFTLQKMQGHQDAEESLRVGWCRWSGMVNVRAEEIYDGMDQKGAQVFNHEDCSPGDLWSQVLDVDCALISKPCGMNGLVRDIW